MQDIVKEVLKEEVIKEVEQKKNLFIREIN